jgi:hypothetical protein
MTHEHHELMLKVRRGLAQSMLDAAERQHAEHFFDEGLWAQIREAAEADGVEPRTLVRKLVSSALRARAKKR